MLLPSIFDDDFVDDLFAMPYTMSRPFRSLDHSLMNVDIEDCDTEYKIDFELPGFKKEDIKADLTNGYLTINASHTENKDEKQEKGRYIRRERYTGQCQRSFYVGEGVTQADIKANFENGVLTVTVPKKEETKKVDEKKYISIEGK